MFLGNSLRHWLLVVARRCGQSRQAETGFYRLVRHLRDESNQFIVRQGGRVISLGAHVHHQTIE